MKIKTIKKMQKKQEVFDQMFGEGEYEKWWKAKKKHRRERSIQAMKMVANLATLGTLFRAK